ncbi:hypothetical protein KIH24_01835 [Rhizobiales bacterium TNE-4]|nr:hypothetical protein [Rhizobiales bacterium TNE-4]MBV1826359.1 hypothetical protein [Rhizobiales bacterium TNE-4]
MAHLKAIFLAAGVAALTGGCMSTGTSSSQNAAAGGTDSSFLNIFKYGGLTKPESMKEEDEDIECPSVQILDGTAALRAESGAGVRHQFSVVQTARECRAEGNNIVIKMGVEGRALLGPSGSPGTFTVPVRFVAKRGETVVASKLQRQSVTIPAGETQQSFITIEEGMTIPKAGAAELELFVGLDASGGATEKPVRKKR